MNDLYIGRGTYEMFDDYMDFINYVFGFNGNEKDMKKLLPKLYRQELAPAEHNFVVLEEGKLKAAVGVYPSRIQVCGTPLSIAGIGNVSVHPYARSKGYMKTLMGMSLDAMKESSADITILSGQRQRYNYFSYEQCGISYAAHLTRANMRHAFGDSKAPFTIKEVTSRDNAELDTIAAISDSGNYVPGRPREEIYNILCSWSARPYAIMDGDRMMGYFVLCDQDITEIKLWDTTDLLSALHTVMAFMLAKHSTFRFKLAPFQTAFLKALEPIADKIQIYHCKMFSVLHFGKVIEAFLKLKATYATLADGEWKILIHGMKGDEALTITVTDGNVSVVSCDTNTENFDNTFTHLEAMRCLFGPVYTGRLELPLHVQNWLPLPLWIFAADCV